MVNDDAMTGASSSIPDFSLQRKWHWHFLVVAYNHYDQSFNEFALKVDSSLLKNIQCWFQATPLKLTTTPSSSSSSNSLPPLNALVVPRQCLCRPNAWSIAVPPIHWTLNPPLIHAIWAIIQIPAPLPFQWSLALQPIQMSLNPLLIHTLSPILRTPA